MGGKQPRPVPLLGGYGNSALRGRVSSILFPIILELLGIPDRTFAAEESVRKTERSVYHLVWVLNLSYPRTKRASIGIDSSPAPPHDCQCFQGLPFLVGGPRRPHHGYFFPQSSLHHTSSCSSVQDSHTQANRHQTAKKKPSQTFQPTPVLSAILNILLIVPFNFALVLSKSSFILSARADESRISSPIAIVSCLSWLTFEERMLVFSFSFCASSDSRTDWEYWPLPSNLRSAFGTLVKKKSLHFRRGSLVRFRKEPTSS